MIVVSVNLHITIKEAHVIEKLNISRIHSKFVGKFFNVEIFIKSMIPDIVMNPGTRIHILKLQETIYAQILLV